MTRQTQPTANNFASSVKAAGIQTDYARLAEFLCNASERHVLGVHYYLSGRTGQLANGGLTNSHWEECDEIRPHHREGGYEVLVRMLRKRWKRS